MREQYWPLQLPGLRPMTAGAIVPIKEERSRLFAGLVFCVLGDPLSERVFAQLFSRGGDVCSAVHSPQVTHYIVNDVRTWEQTRKKQLGRPVITPQWIDACVRKSTLLSVHSVPRPSRGGTEHPRPSRTARGCGSSRVEPNYACFSSEEPSWPVLR